jgi:hypothetical protein
MFWALKLIFYVDILACFIYFFQTLGKILYNYLVTLNKSLQHKGQALTDSRKIFKLVGWILQMLRFLSIFRYLNEIEMPPGLNPLNFLRP